jgi:Family of unknown function (DUF5670)
MRRRTLAFPFDSNSNSRKKHSMLYTIAVVMLLLWLLGMISQYTMNGFVHVLLIVALVVVLVRIIGSRKAI